MSILIPRYDDKFKVKEEVTLKLHKHVPDGVTYAGDRIPTYLWADLTSGLSGEFYTNYEKSDLFNHVGDDHFNIILPKDTILIFKKIDVKRRAHRVTTYYGAWDIIKFDAFHPKFKGIKYKTTPKLHLYLENKDIELLSKLNLEKVIK